MGNIYSVAQINLYIKRMFTQDFILNNICVKGEVSNCKYHTSGHIYFSLKDKDSVMNCVMFAGNRTGLSFKIDEGQTVVVSGSINVYERDGKYQLYAKEITLDGTGQLYFKFELLKKELEEMGMFSDEYKQKIPRFSQKIGIVTAQTGAAIQDIINIAKRRNPYSELILYPAYVQGDEAAPSIVRGIQKLDSMNLDVIIVGRGGGSMEDLWAFNEEMVARAIFNCRTPIISAVGHETDTTIADYVADLRAPTPSAAAEITVFDYYSFEKELNDYKYTLYKLVKTRLDLYKKNMELYALRLKHLSPSVQILNKKQYLADLEGRLLNSITKKTTNYRNRLSVYAERLNSYSPLLRLNNGYAFVTDSKGNSLCDIEDVKIDDKIKINLKNGKFSATVDEIISDKISDNREEI